MWKNFANLKKEASNLYYKLTILKLNTIPLIKISTENTPKSLK